MIDATNTNTSSSDQGKVCVELVAEAIPLLEGARETLRRGHRSSLHPANERTFSDRVHFGDDEQSTHARSNADSNEAFLRPILFDPQTSGGLIVTVPFGHAGMCVEDLRAAGYAESNVIGRVIKGKCSNTSTSTSGYSIFVR